MKKVLIIYPHYPPSNLAGVHRPRLLAAHLPSFGWEPTILTVEEKYYEEAPDHELSSLIPPNQKIIKVKAIKRFGPLGDIGLRAFLSLYNKALQIIRTEKTDFLYIPIPSFYTALLGRLLNNATGIKYGIDYIDPWVHKFPGSEKIFSKAWFSTRLANILEPISVKNASLITGVAEGYFAGVIKRNPYLNKSVITGAMPYGGEISDHQALDRLNKRPYLFQPEKGQMKLVYAGALLPLARQLLEQIFKSIDRHREEFANVEFHFIGTGGNAKAPNLHAIRPLAEAYNLYNSVVFEHPGRIPYLDVLVHLKASDGIFILGSTEPHYSPSKVYQAVLSKQPVLGVLHANSPATKMIEETNAGKVLSFNGTAGLPGIAEYFSDFFNTYQDFAEDFDFKKVSLSAFEPYSAKEVTGKLVDLLNQVS